MGGGCASSASCFERSCFCDSVNFVKICPKSTKKANVDCFGVVAGSVRFQERREVPQDYVFEGILEPLSRFGSHFGPR